MPRSYKVGDEPVPGYRLKRKLGSGAFATVWEASAPGDVSVALKILSLDRKKVLKEFKALNFVKLVRHPNLVSISGIWVKDEDGQILEDSQVISTLSEVKDSPHRPTAETMMVPRPSRLRELELIISMGLCEQTLGDKLAEFQERGWQAIPVRDLIGYMEDAAAAIDFLNTPRHNLGQPQPSAIQHCDIKPQNIMLLAGRAQVCDFGLARIQGGDVKLTSAAATPAYGAPELLDQQPPSPTTDQYSLAISYIELRTGALPFADPDSYMGVVKAHLQGQLVFHNLPAEEQRVLQRATAREPNQRWENCTRLVRELKKALRDELADDSSLSSAYQPPPTDSHRASGGEAPRPRPSASPAGPAVAVGSGFDPGLTATPDDRSLIGTHRDSKGIGRGSVAETYVAPVARRQPLGKKLALTGLLLAAVAGGAFGVWKLIPRPQTPEEMWKLVKEGILFQIEKGQYATALGSIAEAQPPESAARDVEQIRADVLKQWLEKVERQREAADKANDLAGLAAASAMLGEVQKAFGEHQDVIIARNHIVAAQERLTRQVAEDLKGKVDAALGQLDSDPAAAQTALAAALQQALALGEAPERLKLRAAVQLGLAQATARRGNGDQLAAQLAQLDDTLKLQARALVGDKLAIKHVLAAVAARRQKPQSPQAALESLKPLYGSDDLFKRLPEGLWETSQELAIVDWARGANQQRPDPTSADILQLIDGKRNPGGAGKMLDVLLAEADQLRGAGKLDEAREKLTAARAQATPPLDHYLAPIGERETLLTLVDPATDGQAAGAALATLAPLVKAGQITLPAAVAEAAAAAALKDAALFPSADKLLTGLLEVADGSSEPDAAASIVAAQGRLLDTHFGRQLAETAAAADAKVYYERLYDLCRRAKESGKSSPLVRLASMECALADVGSEKPAALAADLQLDKPIDALGVPAPSLPYALYVRAAYLDTVRGTAREALPAELEALVPMLADMPPLLASEQRRARLSGVLARAARRLRAGSEGASLADRLTKVFGEPKNAAQALRWLAAADSLHPLQTTGERSDLILASLAASDSIDDRLRGWTAELVESGEDLGEDAWPLWYAYARTRPNDPSGWAAAARQLQKLYGAIVELRPENESDLIDLYSRVLQPGLARAEKLPDAPEHNGLRAALWAAKGRLLQTARFVDWSAVLKDLSREEAMVEAFERATQLEPQSPEHFVSLGSAKLSLPAAPTSSAILEEALAAAGHAAELSRGKSATALSLRGNVRLLMARRADTTAGRNELLDQAIADCTAANELAQSDPAAQDADQRQTILIHLADAYVGRANFTFDPTCREQKKLLLEAEKYARAATGLTEASYPAHAYRALGNACEDLAWLAGRGDPTLLDKYNDANDAFTEAIDKRLHLAGQAYVDRARCNYKRVADSGQKDLGYLKQAAGDLDQAIEQSPDLSEAYYWRAKVRTWRRQFAAASDDFQAAFDKAEAAERYADAVVYAADLARVPLYDDAIKDVHQRQAQARERAVALRTSKTFQRDPHLRKLLAEIIGSAYKAERQYDQAVAAYQEGLPQDLASAGAADIHLLLGLAECRTQSDKLWDPDAALTLADRAATLAVEWRDNRLHANALGIAGQVARQQYKKSPVDTPEKKTAKLKLLEDAIDKFDRAVATDPGGRDSVVWRLELANLLLVRIVVASQNQDVATHKALHARAMAALDAEVLRSASGDELRKEINRLRTELKTWAPKEAK